MTPSGSDSGSRQGRHDWSLAQGPIEAFGESKNLGAWAKDPRCSIQKATLRGRLALGWDPEDAITTRKGEEPPLRFLHFDRALTLHGWAEQSGISYQALYTRVFTVGTRFRDALLQGPDLPGYDLPVTAFGETKPLHLWALDPRANCTAGRLRWRVEAGWTPEQAITTKPQPQTDTPGNPPQTATRQAPEPVTAQVTVDDLRPGDTVLSTGADPETGNVVLTVRRPATSPATVSDPTAAVSPDMPAVAALPSLPAGPAAPPSTGPRR